ncbi:hypothetical protein SLH46_17765 [Draconibacterium sp. IB214405]|uniref:hypothetical protein n=1 Tax=Draconibacterium sp. IB214405 TaxID=3097352 RepID=UPI002A0B2F27|nr:hypothetical protein [Draconibacterium sp. IB214405]MDX8341051.1 hypothetical protein [Draconibacterium sp. IB214405]
MNITSLTKQQVAKTVISQLEEQSYELSVQTGLLNSYSSSPQITTQSSRDVFSPDILTIEQNGETNIYEIQLNSKIDAEKWRIFSHYTKVRQGELFIIVPEPNLSAAEEAIIKNDIRNIKLMYVPN